MLDTRAEVAAAGPIVRQNVPASGGLNGTHTTRFTRKLNTQRCHEPTSRFFEEASQSAHEANLPNAVWNGSHADFWYCTLHSQVCEMVKAWPESDYDSKCQACTNAAVKTQLPQVAFIVTPLHEPESFTVARNTWLQYCEKRAQLEKMIGSRVEELRFINREERSAFLSYAILATARNDTRVKIISAFQSNQPSGQDISAYNMLPLTADPALVQFVKDSEQRHQGTSAGRSGRSSNVRECEIHQSANYEKSQGHAFQIFSKNRYESCGICTKARGATTLQKQADKFNELNRADLRIASTFDTSNAGLGDASSIR